MDTAKQIMDFLGYIQNNGGIMAMFILVLLIRTLDWIVWHRDIENVKKNSYSALSQHELNYHEKEVLERINRQRRADDNP